MRRASAVYRSERDHLELEMTVFVSPTQPIEFQTAQDPQQVRS